VEFYSFIASEAPTGNATNVNMLDLSVAYEVQFIQYDSKIWVYPVINIRNYNRTDRETVCKI
jgi:hypothetical protein